MSGDDQEALGTLVLTVSTVPFSGGTSALINSTRVIHISTKTKFGIDAVKVTTITYATAAGQWISSKASAAAQIIHATSVSAFTAALPVVTNPTFIQNTVDFVTSAFPGTTPTPNIPGAAGGFVNLLLSPEEELR